jgi:hypothetical protein
MANAIEQKVDVSGAVGDLRLIVEQRPDPPEGKKPHNGMVRRGSLEVVESEEEAFHETTRGRY